MPNNEIVSKAPGGFYVPGQGSYNPDSLSPLDLLRTPSWVYKPLGHFDLDPCAGEHTLIADTNWWNGRGEDGLERDWFGFVYCNPPFSQKEIWAKKMIEHGNGILVLPERGSAPWCGPLKLECKTYFVMGKKINFDGGPSSNNQGTILFLFGEEAISRVKESDLPGDLNEVKWYRSRESNVINYAKQQERR